MTNQVAKNKASILSDEIRKKIDLWLLRYPPEQKRSGVLQALHYVQEAHNNYLTNDLIEAVADYLELPHIAVYEVVSFYTMYNLNPVGKHIINVCTNISCMLSGSEEILKHLENKLQIKVGETTPDGKYTLREVECLAACAGAPMFLLDKTYHENLTPQVVDSILEKLK
jgi:NADH-quinone oxidoreductase subunit E